jgi:carbamoyl-phosphate synthase small subunit
VAGLPRPDSIQQSISTVVRTGRLDLADGTTFRGVVPEGQTSSYFGEVVFNTGMTGYVESLTDPSYAGQILVFTYPLIGNYGVQSGSAESDKIQVSGIIVSEAALNGNHSQSDRSLLDWLRSQDIPILIGVDTRSLTKHLRIKGTMPGSIGIRKVSFESMSTEPVIVSVSQPVTYNQKHKKKVILVDCGLKENILRSLLKLPIQVKRVPHDYDYTNEQYDGVLLSNGPGDPENYGRTIDIASKAMAQAKPVFGICLGSQIMGLAAGAKTYKLKFGHRGHNQPCLETSTNKGYITSQNHGYAIDEQSLPDDWDVSFRNLNDGSVEGISHRSKPFSSVQFHPEACPGPTDAEWMFEGFYATL